MATEKIPPQETGSLAVVATPIGNLGDITERAVAALKQADLVAAEDTRHTGRLLQHLGLSKSMFALHDHNERAQVETLLDRVEAGENVALVSDAGTPLISDPGYIVVRRAHERGLRVLPIPGACAAIAALCVSGLPTDRFVFEGFLPAKAAARRSRLEALENEARTLVFYESPHRLMATIDVLVSVFGPERPVVLARELTKAFETLYAVSLGRLQAIALADPNVSRGELVLVVGGAAEQVKPEETLLDTDRLMRRLIQELPVKTAVRVVADLSGQPRNALYQRALTIQRENLGD
ncbi:MAG: 16S rRNA (cytidine(1402)-2'-O)-methyltransferase [Alteromonadaceae bacterium]|nr:16S rRNA (cytidine(1402)-2'-O)-methyltransferase [Alteromonadaceae bacterium]